MTPQPSWISYSNMQPPQGPNPHYHNTHPTAGPSRVQDDPKREKKKDISGKVGKEMLDCRDEGRHFTENISALHSAAMQLSSVQETRPLIDLCLYPISLERSALLAQHGFEEKHSLESIQTAYEEEQRPLEGIEERRRHAREEKEGEGTVNGTSPSFSPQYPLIFSPHQSDAESRSHITRKLRNKVGTSPPTPLTLRVENLLNGLLGSNAPVTTGPFTDPHSLSVDGWPSPFPFPLTAVTLTNPSSGAGASPGANGSRRRTKGAGLHSSMVGVGVQARA
ncbi:hypothetical protein CY34DRAFT_809744 [Suillus luteus UH-Slu-Lm8-n1]|uniref:Uncharacterized protein n=1 Tax=Suillus luteus UH-Slu-Lm8-n1 TaxID=930992 RepID=A0A0D0B299_9AGAM|nr:hypothetical protein CY34DRAFT_809744 [Suillus luteus UH-Slu-Lm8-n1]